MFLRASASCLAILYWTLLLRLKGLGVPHQIECDLCRRRNGLILDQLSWFRELDFVLELFRSREAIWFYIV
ncbi:hypothetical protein M758_7G031600 [Ceratodon purpureus]|uniref:Secreted protein n=1 Tax=Ceratodon purpureus TaxID=3225 RepID=A0A8T0H461_CERPU|nr:hypothetical protein KC19_7G033100 [Ceratodon purpureus]KAG0610005.1 hypothetical protein M758_7G031600 [Ceratodon purpureus]